MNALIVNRQPPAVRPNGQLTGAAGQNDLIADYMAYLDVKDTTARNYRQALSSWREWLKSRGISQPIRADVIQYRDYLKAGEYAPGTVQTYLTGIKLFYRWTAIEGLYPNISDHVKGAKVTRDHKRDYMTAGQVRDVLEAIDTQTEAGARDYAVILLMVTGGLRDKEVSAANVGDMQLKAGNIVLYVAGKGRDGKPEYVKLAATVEKAIRNYLKYRGSVTDETPLFISNSRNSSAGNRISPRSVSALVKRRLKAAGYDSPKLTAHSLRHTAVTLSLLGGQDLRDVSQFARHKDISTTEIYDHGLKMDSNGCAETVISAIFND